MQSQSYTVYCFNGAQNFVYKRKKLLNLSPFQTILADVENVFSFRRTQRENDLWAPGFRFTLQIMMYSTVRIVRNHVFSWRMCAFRYGHSHIMHPLRNNNIFRQ